MKSRTSHNTIFTHRAFALGPSGVRSGFGGAFQQRGSRFSRTHPHRLTAQAQPVPGGTLSRWDVVNTITLGEIDVKNERALSMKLRSVRSLFAIILLLVILSGCTANDEVYSGNFEKFTGELITVVNQKGNKYSKEVGILYTVTVVNAPSSMRDKFNDYSASNGTNEDFFVITKRTRIFKEVDSERRQLISAEEFELNRGQNIEFWIQPIKGNLHELEAIEIIVLN